MKSKNLLAMVLLFVMVLFTACGSAASQGGSPASSQAAAVHGRALVVYFSRSGNTRAVADSIAEATGADLFEVKPQDESYYPQAYRPLTEVAREEIRTHARPAYAGPVPDLSQYDTIFMGAPVWGGDWPMMMYTFFENNRDVLSGKTLLPFCTHGGSGLSGFDVKLADTVPGAHVGKGLAIRGEDARDSRGEVENWLKQSGY